MRHLVKAFAIACALLVEADAALIERDWITPGDGLLTYDSSSNLEWLDISETRLADFPGILIEDRYQAVAAQTVSGRFAEFRVATSDQAMGLADSAGLNPDSIDFAINGDAANLLFDLVGTTDDVDGFVRLVGLTQDTISRPGLVRRVIFAVSTDTRSRLPKAYSGIGVGHELASQVHPSSDGAFAVLLVRAAVPEPGSLSVVAIGLGLASLNRRKQP